MAVVKQWGAHIVVVVLIFAAGAYLENRASKAEDALCTLRADLEERVVRSRDYLDDLDLGRREPIPGISRADIVQSIENQDRTIRALSPLDC